MSPHSVLKCDAGNRSVLLQRPSVTADIIHPQVTAAQQTAYRQETGSITLTVFTYLITGTGTDI